MEVGEEETRGQKKTARSRFFFETETLMPRLWTAAIEDVFFDRSRRLDAYLYHKENRSLVDCGAMNRDILIDQNDSFFSFLFLF